MVNHRVAISEGYLVLQEFFFYEYHIVPCRALGALLCTIGNVWYILSVNIFSMKWSRYDCLQRILDARFGLSPRFLLALFMRDLVLLLLLQRLAAACASRRGVRLSDELGGTAGWRLAMLH